MGDGQSNQHAPASRDQRGKGWIWPVIITLLLSIHAIMWLVFTYIAVRDPSFAVEPDYYQKSLAWDATMAQLRTNEALGWTAEIETEGDAGIYGDRRIVCRLHDRAGNPVEGATVDAVIFHHARAARRSSVRLAEEAGGIYAARPRMRKRGLWECRLRVRRGNELFTHVSLHEVRSSRGK